MEQTINKGVREKKRIKLRKKVSLRYFLDVLPDSIKVNVHDNNECFNIENGSRREVARRLQGFERDVLAFESDCLGRLHIFAGTFEEEKPSDKSTDELLGELKGENADLELKLLTERENVKKLEEELKLCAYRLGVKLGECETKLREFVNDRARLNSLTEKIKRFLDYQHRMFIRYPQNFARGDIYAKTDYETLEEQIKSIVDWDIPDLD